MYYGEGETKGMYRCRFCSSCGVALMRKKVHECHKVQMRIIRLQLHFLRISVEHHDIRSSKGALYVGGGLSKGERKLILRGSIEAVQNRINITEKEIASREGGEGRAEEGRASHQ